MSAAILMSIRPRFADAILAGEKSHELRRKFAGGGPGTRVFIYSSSPVRQVIGAFEIGTVDTMPRWLVARRRRKATTLTSAEISDYLDGLEHGTLIGIENPFRLSSPISLERLRTWGIEPPQSYRYLPDRIVGLIEADAVFANPVAMASNRSHELVPRLL